MAVTKVQSTRNVAGAIYYLTKEKSHDGIHPRIGSYSTANTMLGIAASDMNRVMKRFRKEKNVQAYLVIQSFANDELNPESQEDLDKANEAGMKLGKAIGGETRQIVVITQADNGNVHNHIVICSTDTLTGKALIGNQKSGMFARQKSDEILKEMGILNKNAEKAQYRDRQTMGEIKRREKGLYVWKDDLKQRIRECLENESVTDEEIFKEKMQEDYKVDVRINGKGNISYRFLDAEGKDRKCRAKRLGTVYGKDGISYGITDNQNKQNRNNRQQSADFSVDFGIEQIHVGHAKSDSGNERSNDRIEQQPEADSFRFNRANEGAEQARRLAEHIRQRDEERDFERAERDRKSHERMERDVRRFNQRLGVEQNNSARRRKDSPEFG